MSRILTISGWTQAPDSLAHLFPQADMLDYAGAVTLDEVAAMLPANRYDLVIGWSLGGVLARQLIKAQHLNAEKLVLVSSAYQFVRSEDFHHAMPQDIFARFYENYRDDTARTIERFHGLTVKGDQRQREVMARLAHHPDVFKTTHWLPWLDYLAAYSAGKEQYQTLPETLIIHGTEDAIIPVAQAEALAAKIPHAQLDIWHDAGHALQWHDPQRLRQRIIQFMGAP